MEIRSCQSPRSITKIYFLISPLTLFRPFFPFSCICWSFCSVHKLLDKNLARKCVLFAKDVCKPQILIKTTWVQFLYVKFVQCWIDFGFGLYTVYWIRNCVLLLLFWKHNKLLNSHCQIEKRVQQSQKRKAQNTKQTTNYLSEQLESA